MYNGASLIDFSTRILKRFYASHRLFYRLMSMTIDTEPDEAQQDRWVAPILSLAQMVSWGAMFYGFAIVLEPLSIEFAASLTTLSATYAFGLLTMGLMAWPVGILIDRGYTRAVMTAGSLLAGLGLALHASAHSVAGLFFAWFVIGVAMAGTLYEPAFAAMIRAYPKSYRSRITVLTLLGGLASTVFWPLTAALTSSLGWREALLSLAALQWLICVPIHWFTLPPPVRVTRGAVRGATQADRRPTLELVKSRLFLCLTISFATHLLVMSAFAALLVGMLVALKISHQNTLLVVASIGPMQFAGRLLLLLTERRWSSERSTRIILWMPALAVALFLMLSLVDAPAWIGLAFVAAAVYGAGNGMLTIIKGTAVAELVGPSRVATLNGIAAIPSAFFRAAGPFFIAAIWEQSASIPIALLALLLAAAVSAQSFISAQRYSELKQR
jgi:MFS family permease